ncbi:hypothetical protein DICA3_C15104 [Diutina catenulata]
MSIHSMKFNLATLIVIPLAFAKDARSQNQGNFQLYIKELGGDIKAFKTPFHPKDENSPVEFSGPVSTTKAVHAKVTLSGKTYDLWPSGEEQWTIYVNNGDGKAIGFCLMEHPSRTVKISTPDSYILFASCSMDAEI